MVDHAQDPFVASSRGLALHIDQVDLHPEVVAHSDDGLQLPFFADQRLVLVTPTGIQENLDDLSADATS